MLNFSSLDDRLVGELCLIKSCTFVAEMVFVSAELFIFVLRVINIKKKLKKRIVCFPLTYLFLLNLLIPVQINMASFRFQYFELALQQINNKLTILNCFQEV